MTNLKNKRLFGTSGIRRKNEELTEEFVTKLGYSLGTYSKDKSIAIGRDTRASSPELESWFTSALLATGHDVVQLGVVPTPTLGMAALDYGTGVMVTASHNPPEWNGFKFWSRDGAYKPEQERDVEEIFYSNRFEVGESGKAYRGNYVEKHIEKILKDVGKVKKPVKVLVDCANGSGSVLTPQLLERMGCEVIAINTELDGNFPHGLEPTAENLRETCKLVDENNVDIGIAHDGDADRSAAIGRDGKLIDWDSLLSVLAYGKEKVVTTVDASMRIEDVCKKVIRVPVGDVAVANAILREGAEFGGEPSGSFIFQEVHLFPDGPLTAAKIVKLISEDRFYKILGKIRDYPMERVKIPCREELKPLIMSRLKGMIKGNVSYVDGIRLTTEKGWILIRPSGTEPYVRITAEAGDEDLLNELVENGRKWIKEAMNSLKGNDRWYFHGI